MEELIKDIKEKYNKSSKYVLYLDYKDIGILFRYIEKQQKEIEELKSEYKDLFFQNFDLWEKNIFPKKAIETLKEVASDDFDTLGDDISPKMAQNILNVIEKQQKEIEEKTTILLAGAEKVKQLEKEIEELKKENNEIWGHLPRLD